MTDAQPGIGDGTGDNTGPAPRHPGVLVLTGGAAGALARWAFTVDSGLAGSLWSLLLVNLSGAFLMGVLVGYLPFYGGGSGDPVADARDSRHRAELKLLLGTGFCGGFTSYSAIASVTVLDAGSVTGAVVYLLSTVLLGLALAWAGLRSGENLGRDVAPGVTDGGAA